VEPVVLFTTLGPNPAPLAELLWALARHHQRLVVEAHVVVAQRGALYLEGELLDPGGLLTSSWRSLARNSRMARPSAFTGRASRTTRIRTTLMPTKLPSGALWRPTVRLWNDPFFCTGRESNCPTEAREDRTLSRQRKGANLS
jgi:hypothetical protein